VEAPAKFQYVVSGTDTNYQNKILFFFDGQKALDHISSTDELPFLILSDINMPKLDGFALRQNLKQMRS